MAGSVSADICAELHEAAQFKTLSEEEKELLRQCVMKKPEAPETYPGVNALINESPTGAVAVDNWERSINSIERNINPFRW